MEDGLNIDDSSGIKMGATSNPNASRAAILQERKKSLEEIISKRNRELKQLCIQEAELTGIMPAEIPLEPGESPPSFRRKVYTLYQLSQNLIDNVNKDEESISELELALQVQAKLAEAALGLANESNVTKNVRRQHMQQYQQHKQQYNALKDKLDFLKTRSQLSQQLASSPSQQQKQKKKPRPLEQDDAVSMNVNLRESFGKSPLRHSMRSLQNPPYNSIDQRFLTQQRHTYRSAEGLPVNDNQRYVRQEDILTSGIYRLSLNGYKNYVERQECGSSDKQVNQQYVSQSNPNLHQKLYQPGQTGKHTLPHMSHQSPQMILPSNSYGTMNAHYNHQVNSHQANSHQVNSNQVNSHQVNSHQVNSHQANPHQVNSHQVNSHQVNSHQANPHQVNSYQVNSHQVNSHQGNSHQVNSHQVNAHQGNPHQANSYQMNSQQLMHDCNKYNTASPHVNSHTPPQIQRNNNPIVSNSNSNLKMQYYPSHNILPQQNYRPHSTFEPGSRNLNPHQIQPHQQYEHDVMTSGLGGFWKRSENGELIWFNNIPNTNSIWQRNKRFGSLDRRKNKRLHKRPSPNADAKSATISSTHVYNEPAHQITAKISQPANQSLQDTRQLVRTQSLGSVGVQSIDNPWPSDDNSSCDSDTHSFNDLNPASKKLKKKEWYETSLDGPLTPTSSIASRSYSTLSIAPEEKYVETPILTPSLNQKPSLEIPAESNPSPRVQDTNMKIFNNNIPKNCTVVQAAQWKPYHEETKPFEMSDFYKYSTKYKKSPSKQDNEGTRARSQSIGFRQLPSPQEQNRPGNLSDNYDDDAASVICKGVYQPLQPMKCHPYSPNKSANHSVGSIGGPTSLNASLDLSQLTSNIAENFSVEMNAWYQNHEHHAGSKGGSAPMPKQCSTATLV